MTTFEHIKAHIVTIAEHTRPYLKKAWTIGCAYAVKFADWCKTIYHKAKPHVIVGWKRLHPYLKRAWHIGGVAAEKVADCCKETYRLAKPHVIAGWEKLRQWFAGLSPRGKNIVKIVSGLCFVSLLGLAVARMSGSGAPSNNVPQESIAVVTGSAVRDAQPKNDSDDTVIAKNDAKEIPSADNGSKKIKGYLEAHEKNYEDWRRAAEQGDAEAQFKLGNYIFDKGVPKDKAKGVRWIRRAADQGHTEAQVWVGSAYLRGEIVPKNKEEAEKWFRKAAKQENLEVESNKTIELAAEVIPSNEVVTRQEIPVKAIVTQPTESVLFSSRYAGWSHDDLVDEYRLLTAEMTKLGLGLALTAGITGGVDEVTVIQSKRMFRELEQRRKEIKAILPVEYHSRLEENQGASFYNY